MLFLADRQFVKFEILESWKIYDDDPDIGKNQIFYVDSSVYCPIAVTYCPIAGITTNFPLTLLAGPDVIR